MSDVIATLRSAHCSRHCPFFFSFSRPPFCHSVSRPQDKPPFSVAELKKAIPAHCFQRSTLRSLSYLLLDLLAMAGLFALSTLLTQDRLPTLCLYALWPLYWLVQGSVATGVWVLAHECGHQAFSEANWINDSLGFILHSFLMVPYFSW